MRVVRPIELQELDAFVTISAHAYPGIEAFSQAERNQLRERLLRANETPHIQLFALFEDGEMRGVMRLYDFKMKMLSTRALVGGVGGLAVDLLHKKERIAADMLRAFLQHYRERGACLAALYPFRLDFYKRMGFGYGTKMNAFCFRPASLPKGPSKQHVHTIKRQDLQGLQACYDRFLDRSNGLMERTDDVWDALFSEPTIHIVGVKRTYGIGGYLVYKFTRGRHDHFLSNDILIYELVYDTADDLAELLTFLHTQEDQIEQVIFNTQDESFHYLLRDPRNGSGKMLPSVTYHESNTQGLGIMYRVINMPQLFKILENHNFGDVTCRVQIDLSDSFMPQNGGQYLVHFEDGRAFLAHDGDYDVSIQLDVAEFSSLITGAVRFGKLYEYGLASVSDHTHVNTIDRIFTAPKPVCMTRF